MTTRQKMTFLVLAGCFLFSGISFCLADSESKQELLALLPDKAGHLWILGKTPEGLAEPGVISGGGIMSPDKAWYAIRPRLGSGNGEERIILGNTDTGDETVIPASKDPRTPCSAPVWSPDSTSLVYVTRRGLDPTLPPGWGVPSHSAIIRYDVVTGTTSEILRRKGRIRSIRYVDSGKALFFLWEPSKGEGDYMLLDLDTGTVSFFKEDIPFDHTSWPLHAPDGDHIAYTLRRGTYIYDVRKKESREVLKFQDAGYLFSMVWSPNSRFLAGVLLRPSRNPLARWTLLFTDNIKHVYEFWAYDTKTGETVTMRMNDRIREALITWPR